MHAHTGQGSNDRTRFKVQSNTLVLLATGFYRSNDPTNSVNALNEDRLT